MHGWPARGARLGFDGQANRRVDFGHLVKTVNQCAEIQHAAPNQYRTAPPSANVLDAATGIPGKICGGVNMGRVADMHKVVGVIGFSRTD